MTKSEMRLERIGSIITMILICMSFLFYTRWQDAENRLDMIQYFYETQLEWEYDYEDDIDDFWLEDPEPGEV